MPLLCVRCLLALLLLPLALSCNQRKPRAGIANLSILRTDLHIAKRRINDSLHNVTCPEPRRRQRDCTSDNADEVDVVLWQYCKMTSLAVEATDQLIDGLMYSLPCTCEDLPTKAQRSRNGKRRRGRRRRKRTTTPAPAATTPMLPTELQKLCKVKAILAAMTVCFQMLSE